MIGIRTLARSLISSIFVVGGATALMRSKEIAPAVGGVAQPIADKIGLSKDTEHLVKINAGVQLGAGALFALGVVPRVTGTVLAATLVPTTVAAHPFWEESDSEARNSQLMAFLKNAAILGGLIYVALDTGGRPSVFWSGRKAAVGAGEAIGATARSVADTLSPN